LAQRIPEFFEAPFLFLVAYFEPTIALYRASPTSGSSTTPVVKGQSENIVELRAQHRKVASRGSAGRASLEATLPGSQ
jgi:hypothetical protein